MRQDADQSGRRYHRWVLGALLLITLLALGRVLLPYWLLHKINDRLGQLDAYQGHVEDVDVFLPTGTYQVDGLVFKKPDGKVPLLSVDAVRFSLKWAALLQGRLEGQVLLRRPVLNLVDGPDAGKRQFGTEQAWQSVVREAYPLAINYVKVVDGEMHFRNFHSQPEVDFTVRKIHGLVANLHNRAGSPGGRRAEVRIDAVVHERTPVALWGSYQWLDLRPDFAFDFELKPLPLTALKSLARVYANADPAGGTMTLTAKIRTQGRQLEGYVQPLFEDLEILQWQQDVKEGGKNPFQLAWEAVLAFITSILENERSGKVGAKVPISGEIGTAAPEVLSAVISSVGNAFGKALNNSIEDPIHLPHIQEQEESG